MVILRLWAIARALRDGDAPAVVEGLAMPLGSPLVSLFAAIASETVADPARSPVVE